MEKQQTSAKTSTRYRQRRPPLYDVIIHNDDFTTMEFVVMILQTIFDKSIEEAERLMWYVHEHGEAVAGTYIYDVAHSKADKAKSLARRNNFPLKLTVNQKF
jgi:ATP-dependent Clp protease adaptor protein ClpS